MADENDTDQISRKGVVLKGSTIAIIVGLAGGTAGIGALWTMPYRLEQTEKAVIELRRERNADHEMLVRIDSQIQSLRNDLSTYHLNNRMGLFGTNGYAVPGGYRDNNR